MIETEGILVEGDGAGKKLSLVVVTVCVFLSVIFTRTGFLSMFFLAPLGYAVLVCNSVWLVSFLAVFVNAGCIIIMRLFMQSDPVSSGGMTLEVLYFTALLLGFAWIMGKNKLRTAYRFVLASAAGAVLFLAYINSPNSAFYDNFSELSKMLASVFADSNAVETAGRSVLPQMTTPEKVMEVVKIFILRGGAFVSTAFVFFVNRYAAIKVFSIFKRQKIDRGLTVFFAPPFTIWVLSISLAVILLTRMFRVHLLEILAWNVFVICAIIFLAQGAGILLSFLARRAFIFRILFGVFIILAVFSPGLNMLAVSAVLLLGILENWLPLRAFKQGQASTPEP